MVYGSAWFQIYNNFRENRGISKVWKKWVVPGYWHWHCLFSLILVRKYTDTVKNTQTHTYLRTLDNSGVYLIKLWHQILIAKNYQRHNLPSININLAPYNFLSIYTPQQTTPETYSLCFIVSGATQFCKLWKTNAEWQFTFFISKAVITGMCIQHGDDITRKWTWWKLAKSENQAEIFDFIGIKWLSQCCV